MKKLNIILMFVGMTTFSFGQKIVKVSGNLSFLKGQQTINLEYDYSEMAVGKFKEEAKYIEDGVADRNKKEAGTGEKWKDSWFSSRDRVYHPKFEALFNKGGEKMGLSGSRDNATAQYTLIVKTTFTEPGFNIGLAKKEASINVEYIFIETSTKKELARYKQATIPGAQAMGMDFDTSTRISESYAKAGKMIIAFIAKNAK